MVQYWKNDRICFSHAHRARFRSRRLTRPDELSGEHLVGGGCIRTEQLADVHVAFTPPFVVVAVFLGKDNSFGRIGVLEEIHIGNLPAFGDVREHVTMCYIEQLGDRQDTRGQWGCLQRLGVHTDT